MTRPTTHPDDATIRREAADQLRVARAAPRGQRGEPAGWALAALPDSVPARCLYIQSLIDDDHCDKADAVIAQSVLRRPTDPRLALLSARSLAAQGRDEEAARELELSLRSRPSHGPTLQLAGEIALRLDRGDEAIVHFRRAVDLRPACPARRERFIASLLAAGDVDGAAAALLDHDGDSPLLRARVLRARGRHLEAAELLDAALRQVGESSISDPMGAELIDLLEEMQDVRWLRRVVRDLGHDQPLALARAGQAQLALGEFDDALRVLSRLIRVPGRRRWAMHALVVAASLAGRPRAATRHLRRLDLHRHGVDRGLMAECWRRGLAGRLIRGQTSPRAAGADPGSSVLQPLLRQAARVFENEAARPETPDGERDRFEHQRVVCLAVLASSGATGDAGGARPRS